jgi:hypothetical protein
MLSLLRENGVHRSRTKNITDVARYVGVHFLQKPTFFIFVKRIHGVRHKGNMGTRW